MKNLLKTILLAVLFMTGFIYSAKSTEVRVPSKISHVTVYRQNARLTHNATALIPAGSNTLILEKLTTYIDPNSLQVKISDPVRVVSVSFRTNYLESPDNSKMIKPLNDSMEDLNYLLNWIHDQQSIFEGEEKVVMSNTKAYTEQQPVNVANLQGLVEYYRKRLFEIKSELLKLSKQEKNVRERIGRIQNLINQYGTSKSTQVGEIVVEILSNVQSNVDIEFSYVVTTAGWTPLYEIRSDGSEKPVIFTYKANIYQNTGFEWSNVSITVSTGNPTANNDVPVFTTQFLNFFTGLNTITWKQPLIQRSASSEKEKAPAMVNAQDFDMGRVETTVTENQINTEFDVPMKYNVPSDGQNHLVTMKDYSMPAIYEYFSLPDKDKSVFLVAKIPEWGKLNLLPGKANLFLENSYIGQTDINPYTTIDTMMISFGRSEKVTISREKAMDFTTIKYIGANKKISYAFDITVRNGKNIPVKIMIWDNLPISQNNDITVDPGDLGGAELNKDNGKLEWKLELKPNETRKIRFTYQVKYPKDKTVTGLD